VIQKTVLQLKTRSAHGFWILLSFVLFGLGCAKDAELTVDEANVGNNAGVTDPSEEITTRAAGNYMQVNLVSSTSAYDAAATDADLINAWGLAFSPSQEIWVTAYGSDYVKIFNNQGKAIKPALELEGEPIGIVYNTSSGFKIPGTDNIARFIFATDEGTIAAWTPWNPDETVTILDYSGGLTAYTGLEIAKNKGYWHLYAANVGQGRIDVFDKNFNPVTTMSFEDPNLPDGASPFNIRLINDKLYVTYVGPGGGLVNVFKTDGTFVKRFATGGTLAAPWGITKVPLDFGLGHAILVGNFGNGRINIFDFNGNFKGQLNNENGLPITIDGLWALAFPEPSFNGFGEANLYFTAGPDEEEEGLFGYLEKVE
jgi:uncharacterized protein (TIGR03118 family)